MQVTSSLFLLVPLSDGVDLLFQDRAAAELQAEQPLMLPRVQPGRCMSGSFDLRCALVQVAKQGS